MSTTTWRQDIEDMANGEPIEGVVIGELIIYSWYENGVPPGIPDYKQHRHNVVLTWAEAAPMLEYLTEEPEPVYAWTANRVIFMHEYDSCVWLQWLPRHPQPCMPCYDGKEERR